MLDLAALRTGRTSCLSASARSLLLLGVAARGPPALLLLTLPSAAWPLLLLAAAWPLSWSATSPPPSSTCSSLVTSASGSSPASAAGAAAPPPTPGPRTNCGLRTGAAARSFCTPVSDPNASAAASAPPMPSPAPLSAAASTSSSRMSLSKSAGRKSLTERAEPDAAAAAAALGLALAASLARKKRASVSVSAVSGEPEEGRVVKPAGTSNSHCCSACRMRSSSARSRKPASCSMVIHVDHTASLLGSTRMAALNSSRARLSLPCACSRHPHACSTHTVLRDRGSAHTPSWYSCRARSRLPKLASITPHACHRCRWPGSARRPASNRPRAASGLPRSRHSTSAHAWNSAASVGLSAEPRLSSSMHSGTLPCLRSHSAHARCT
mmetsp:Transcript_22405/g.57034  ORF Transcript_22405/g.57034 Transcript_22405/m.57034 type:complete len:382 (-) Transcript_22405:308-1453(-)